MCSKHCSTGGRSVVAQEPRPVHTEQNSGTVQRQRIIVYCVQEKRTLAGQKACNTSVDAAAPSGDMIIVAYHRQQEEVQLEFLQDMRGQCRLKPLLMNTSSHQDKG